MHIPKSDTSLIELQSFEEALKKATDKFIDRFENLENEAVKRGVDIMSASMPELDAIWDEIKHKKA